MKYDLARLVFLFICAASTTQAIAIEVITTKENDQDTIFSSITIDSRGDELFVNYGHDYMFTIDQPAKKIWPYFRNFNLWMAGSTYNTDNLEEEVGNTIYFSINDDKNFSSVVEDTETFRKYMRVHKVVPEQLLVMDSLTLDEKNISSPYIFSFHEHGGKTTIRLFAVYAPAWIPKNKKDELVSSLKVMFDNTDMRWQDVYVPRLKQLVDDGE